MFNQTLYNLQDGQDNVINIAEATGLPPLCMVKSSRPVDCHLDVAKDHKEEELVGIGPNLVTITMASGKVGD